MVALLNPEERRLFSAVLDSEAKRIGGEWYIDGDGPVQDLDKVVDALFDGKMVHLRKTS